MSLVQSEWRQNVTSVCSYLHLYVPLFYSDATGDQATVHSVRSSVRLLFSNITILSQFHPPPPPPVFTSCFSESISQINQLFTTELAAFMADNWSQPERVPPTSFTIHFPAIHFNIIFPLHSCCSNWCFPLGSPNYFFYLWFWFFTHLEENTCHRFSAE
jgi:hypothetical protein